MNKATTVPAAIALIAASLRPLQATAAMNADGLLTEGVSAPHYTSYIAQVENVRFGSHTTRAILVRVEHLAPNLTRRSYLAPEKLFGNSIVQDADHLYEFDVHHRRLIESIRNDRDDLSTIQNFALLARNYRAVLGSDTTIAGVKAQCISLLNRRSGKKTMTIWFDEHTHLIVAKEAFHSDGAVAYQMRFETLRYTDDIPGSVFSKAAPPGFTVVTRDQQQTLHQSLRETIRAAHFKACEPRALPDGFALVAASLPQIRGIEMLHLLYSDGIRSVSIFENEKDSSIGLNGYTPQVVSIDGHDAKAITDGPNSLLTWRSNENITFTLVGDLSDQELIKIADTLR